LFDLPGPQPCALLVRAVPTVRGDGYVRAFSRPSRIERTTLASDLALTRCSRPRYIIQVNDGIKSAICQAVVLPLASFDRSARRRAMILRQFLHSEPVAASYLFGCGGSATAAVVDPVGEVSPYLRAAEATGMRIRYVIDTHIHADHI